MGIVLLSAAGAAFMAGTRATALLTDDALLVARAHSLSGSAGERTQFAPCNVDGASRGQDLPRVHVVSSPLSNGNLQGATVVATLLLSPFALHAASASHGSAFELSLSAARACR